MRDHDGMNLFLYLLFGAFAVLFFVGASEYDVYGQAARGVSENAVKCVDTDDGFNTLISGTTYMSNNNKKFFVFQDYCRNYDSQTLVEYYCEYGKIEHNDHDCEYGCSRGECNTLDEVSYWTAWIDRDNPSGMSDFEHKMDSKWVCAEPAAVECQRTSGMDYIAAGQDVFCNRDVGSICYNGHNPEGCYDYKVRYMCWNETIFNGSESEYQCTETDDGRDLYTKGFTEGITAEGDRTFAQKLMDHCQTPTNLNLLVEYYCGEDGYLHEELAINCPNGCFDGACRPESYCGDGIINDFPNELCDGYDLGGLSCEDIGPFLGGLLQCSPDCTFDVHDCNAMPPPTLCGDGVIDPGEDCDTALPVTLTCVDFGNYVGGTLSCNSNCEYDLSQCILPDVAYCGDGVRNFMEQCDGTDLGVTCSDINGYVGGILGCYSPISPNACRWDTSNCDLGYGHCGDNVINNYPNEQCDGLSWGSIVGCEDLGFQGGTLTCNGCQFDTTQCITPAGSGVCGDDVIGVGEQCEAAMPYTASCTDFDSFIGGNIACNNCMYDLSQCTPPIIGICGDGLISGSEECDGSNLGVTSCSDIAPYHISGTLSCYPPGSQNECLFDASNCCVIPECAAPPMGCYYDQQPNPDGCPSCGNLICTGICGDGIVQQPNSQGQYEHCDGSLNGLDCTQFNGYTGGVLTCNNCNWDTSGCTY